MKFPKLSLGLCVPYGEGTLGVPRRIVSHLNHSAYLSKDVRTHLRPNGSYICLLDVASLSPLHCPSPISLAMLPLQEIFSLLLPWLLH